MKNTLLPWHTRLRVWWQHSDENGMGLPVLLKTPRVWLDWHFGAMGGGKIGTFRDQWAYSHRTHQYADVPRDNNA